MGTSSSGTWSGTSEMQGTRGLQHEISCIKMQDLGNGLVNTTGEPRRTEVTEADGQSVLSKVVAVSVVEGVE
jgi:hypothetical protein